MNTKHEDPLAALIDRELKALPPLVAPASLAPRVMARLADQAQPAWYRRAWPTWPPALRVAAFAVLLTVFGGLCFAGWEAMHGASAAAASEKAGGLFAWVSVVVNTVGALGNAAAQVVRHLGTGAIVTLIALAAMAYAACVAFGSFYVRVAFARR